MGKKVLIVGARKYIAGSAPFMHKVKTYPIEFVGDDALVPEEKYEDLRDQFANLPAFVVEKRIRNED